MSLPRKWYLNIETFKATLNSSGIGSKPIWITEYGIATKEDAGGLIRQDDQASVILRHNILQTYLAIENSFIYELKDTLSADPSNTTA